MLSRAGKAVFEPGVSFHFLTTGRIVDHSSMKTSLVAMSNSTILVEFCTLILVYVYVLGSVIKCFFFFSLCLLLLRNVVMREISLIVSCFKMRISW